MTNDNPRRLRLLSYNIHQGLSVRPRRLVLSTIKEAIRTADADIVFLQEVVGTHRDHAQRWSDWRSAQFEYLADEVWPHYAYGQNAVYDAGDHGNAILSRFPIVRSHNHDISTGKGERRGMLQCEIEWFPGTPTPPLSCFCTHLELSRRGRERQLRAIGEIVCHEVATTRPLLLAGDFNDWNRRACRELERIAKVVESTRIAGRALVRTFPSTFPLLPLDRVYVRGFAVTKVAALRGAPWSRLSDHLPIVVEVEHPIPQPGEMDHLEGSTRG